MSHTPPRSLVARYLLVMLVVVFGPPLVGAGPLAQAQPEGSIEQADKYLLLCEMMERNDQPQMALQGCLMAIEIYQDKLGDRDPKTRRTAEMLVRILEAQGKNAEAEQIRQHFLAQAASTEPAPSSPPPQPASPPEPSRREQMHKLAQESVAAKEAGHFEEAIDRYQKLLGMLGEDGQTDSPIARKIREELAYAYGRQLRYGEAEPLLRLNLEQTERGGNAAEMASARQALALSLFAAGQLDRARALYEENLRQAQAQDPDSLQVGLLLVQLAKLSEEAERHDEARKYGERAYEIAQLHSQDPMVLMLAEVVLGRIYTTQGLYDRALPLLESALQRAEQDPGAKAALTGSLWALGWIHRSKGDYPKAELYWQRELALEEHAEGPKGMGLSSVLNHLAELYWVWGQDKERIMPLAQRASEIEDRKYAALLSGGTEQMKAAYVQRYVQGTDRVVTYHLHFAQQDSQAGALAMNTILRRKGRVLDAVVDTMQALRERAGGNDAAKLEEIQNVRRQIATLTLRGKPDAMSDDAYRAKLAELEQRDEQLQTELGSAAASFRAEQQPLAFEAVQREIPDNAALVEIIGYRKFDIRYQRFADAFGPLRYGAYVLRRSGKPTAVDLGPASSIDTQIAAFRAALASPASRNVQALGKSLFGQVLKPLTTAIGDAEHLLLAPDGMLNLVPFGALVDEQGRYLVERYELSYLASGRDLLSLQSRSDPKGPPLVLGNPSFDASSSGSAAGSDAHRGARSVDFSRVRFPPLPGTAEEVSSISEMLDDAKLITEAEATEAAVKAAAAPVLLHVATHGFFLADVGTARSATRALHLVDGSAETLRPVEQESPLVRSGLAFAGANRHDASSGEDGVLTALEVTGLDLVGTQLVVLSACETGVGEVRNGDGVHGLRRAFVIAGAESQVMSLWKVDDEATRDLMIDFYEALTDGKGRSAALREVQREMASSDERAHPYYWAAFIASGRWDPMRFDWDQPEEEEEDDDSDGLDFDWTFEARQFPDLRIDVIGNYIQPDSYDGVFSFGAAFEMTPLVGDPDDIIGFAVDMGMGIGFNTDANLGLDAHVGVGPGFWLGPFALAPYLGLGMDMVGTRPDDEAEPIDSFIMDPAFYWYAGGRLRFAISAFALEGYLVRTARGSIIGDAAVDIPNQTRLVTRAVIRFDEEAELAGGFHFTDYDAEALGGVGMGGLLSLGTFFDEGW